jgi:WD40-like Beta Propeller Repeat
MDQDLKRMFEMKEADVVVPPTLSPELRSRIGRKRMVMGGLVAAATLVLAIGGFAGARSLSRDDTAPVPPAEEKEQESESMRNGRILHGQVDDMYWEGSTAPPPPGGDLTYHWDAFDQDTGRFLYVAQGYWVIGEDGPPVAEFDCPISWGCGGGFSAEESFGPDADEITVPSQDLADSGSVRVIGFDGTLRDTIDIASATSPLDQTLSDLEWSPDGNRLAVSTEPEGDCDRSGDQCGGRVWIFDRDGGEPQLVYSEGAKGYDALRDLAWSPDSTNLAALVAPAGSCGFPVETPPRVVVLRASPDEPVGVETQIVFEDDGNRDGCILAHHLRLDFPFAWSPDGTRIAIMGRADITEVSAENGDVLARHDALGAEGPMAWLPKS